MVITLYFSQLGRVAVLDKRQCSPLGDMQLSRIEVGREWLESSPQSACMQVDEDGSHLRQVWPSREYGIS